MPPQKEQLLPLTGIRFFLALWVVIFHQTNPDGYLGESLAQMPTILFCLLRTGYLAVGVFFVLSGFVLSYTYSLVNSWSSSQLVRFAAARFARIYPAYCIGLLLVAPFVASYIVKNFTTVRLGKQTAVALLNWTLLQSWIPKTALSWNGPGWSLSNEAFFYCCFPFIGVALWKLSGMRILIAGSSIWAAALFVPLLAVSIPLSGFGDVAATSLHLSADPFWANLIKFNPLLCIPEFCIGILLGRAYHELRSKNSLLLGRGYYLYLPGLFLEVLAIAYCNVLPYPLVHSGLFLPIHSLVIFGLALGGGIPASVLSTRPLVFLGNASYSMYILHSPTSAWINTIEKRLFSSQLSGISGILIYVSVVVCLSAVVFTFFEQPANRVLKMKLIQRFDVSRHKTSAQLLQPRF